MKHYKEAHSKGDSDATNNLGILCQKQGDVVRACLLFEESHNKGELNGTSNSGILCNEQGDVVRACRLF